jgi:N-acetylglutamate synthase-like GNAT family acetyltransferase
MGQRSGVGLVECTILEALDALGARPGRRHRGNARVLAVVEERDIARMTRLIQRGGIIAIAVDETSGTVAGTGLIDVADHRPAVGELAAVGVLTAFRRRGIASAVSAYLVRSAHFQGISLVFLEAEPEEEQIYRRTGFTDATAKIWASIR